MPSTIIRHTYLKHDEYIHEHIGLVFTDWHKIHYLKIVTTYQINQIKFIHSNKHIILHGSLFIQTCCQDDAWPKFGRLPAPPVSCTIIWWYVYGGWKNVCHGIRRQPTMRLLMLYMRTIWADRWTKHIGASQDKIRGYSHRKTRREVNHPSRQG